MLLKCPFLLFGLASATLASLSPVSAQTYTVTNLGTLPGWLDSNATGINKHGAVTGSCRIKVVGSDGSVGYSVHAFLYRNGKVSDLGVLPCGGVSFGQAINNRGEVAGTVTATQGEHAFLYSHNTMKDLGVLPGGHLSYGTAINDQGEVAGYSDCPTGTQAFLYSGGVMRQLVLAAKPGSDIMDSHSFGLNSASAVTGQAYKWSNGQRNYAFLLSNGKARSIGLLPGGYFCRAKAINNRGLITGEADTTHRTPHIFLYSDGIMHDMGTLPGYTSSVGEAINNRAEIVGCTDPDGAIRRIAFICRKGKATDLNHLLSRKDGWILEDATGINDRGQIVGNGIHHGKPAAFLLTPKH